MLSTSTLNILFTFYKNPIGEILLGKYYFSNFRSEESEAHLLYIFIKNMGYLFNKNKYPFILWLIINIRSSYYKMGLGMHCHCFAF